MGALSLLLGLFVLVGYIWLAGPTFYWLDSSEFTAAAWGLGIAHPPGHPLNSLIGHLACYIPVGTLSFRVTLASALEAAGVTTLVALICHQVLLRFPPATTVVRWVRPFSVAVAALSVGFSYALGFQAVRAEVYALNLLLLAGAVYLALSWDWSGDRRRLLAAALLIGLGLCNHHLLVILALPPLTLFVLWRRPTDRARRFALGLLLTVALGLSTLAYLPLRAAQTPEVNWGNPTTLERFYWVISAEVFQTAPESIAAPSAAQRGSGVAFALLGGLGPLATLLGLGGLYFMLRRRAHVRLGLLFSGLVLLNMCFPFLVGFDPLNPDAHGYLAVAVAFLSPGLCLFIVIAVETAALAGRRGVVLVALVCMVASGSLMYQGASLLERGDLKGHWAAEETARQILAQPPGALLLTSYFETTFNLWAIQSTTDLRPDVLAVHRNFLNQPGYVEAQGKRSPLLKPYLVRWRDKGHMGARDLDQLAGRRSVRVEYDLNIPPSVITRLQPAGLTLAVGDPGIKGAFSAHTRQLKRWARALGPMDEGETRRTAAWTHYLLTHFACLRKMGDLARFHFARAHALAPNDIRLQSLARRCGLSQWQKHPGL